MKFYLIKYRVTIANVISNAIETYDSIEAAEAKYYDNLAEAITNNKLKYVMLSILDSEGNDVRHTSTISPGEIKPSNKYSLIEYSNKIDNTMVENFMTYDTLEDAKIKLEEGQNGAKEDDTIMTFMSIIINSNGSVEFKETINGGGFLDYKNKYLVFVNKTKNDNTYEPTITRYDTQKAAEAYVYRLISNSINDTTLFYIDCRIEDATGNTLLHERKSCKGRIPVEE